MSSHIGPYNYVFANEQERMLSVAVRGSFADNCNGKHYYYPPQIPWTLDDVETNNETSLKLLQTQLDSFKSRLRNGDSCANCAEFTTFRHVIDMEEFDSVGIDAQIELLEKINLEECLPQAHKKPEVSRERRDKADHEEDEHPPTSAARFGDDDESPTSSSVPGLEKNSPSVTIPAQGSNTPVETKVTESIVKTVRAAFVRNEVSMSLDSRETLIHQMQKFVARQGCMELYKSLDDRTDPTKVRVLSNGMQAAKVYPCTPSLLHEVREFIQDFRFYCESSSKYYPGDTTQVLGISQTESHLLLFYELADFDLNQYLQKCNSPCIDFARHLALLVVELLRRFHGRGCYVGDVKLSNFLVHCRGSSPDIRLSIADAGCFDNALRRVTTQYAAPEFFAARARPDNNTTFGKRLDVYYLGRVLLAIFLRLISGAPFPFVRFITESPALDLSLGTDANNPFHCRVKKEMLGQLLPDCVIEILNGCFESDPEKRLTVKQLEHKLHAVGWNNSMARYNSYNNTKSGHRIRMGDLVEYHLDKVSATMQKILATVLTDLRRT